MASSLSGGSHTPNQTMDSLDSLEINQSISSTEERSASRCAKLARLLFLTKTGISLWLITYTLLSAVLLFTTELESGKGKQHDLQTRPEMKVQNLVQVELFEGRRKETIDKLWNITETLNVLYRDNWTHLADQEIFKMQSDLFHTLRKEFIKSDGFCGNQRPQNGLQQLSIQEAFLYSLTLITTIGYSPMVELSTAGKVISILVSLFGLPILILYLTLLGGFGGRCLTLLYGKIRCCRRSGNTVEHTDRKPFFDAGSRTTIQQDMLRYDLAEAKFCNCCHSHSRREPGDRGPLWISLAFLIIYVFSGSVLFCLYHNTGYVDALYYCFSLLWTLGFHSRDIKKASLFSSANKTGEGVISVMLTSCFILIGLILMSTCVHLVYPDLCRLYSSLLSYVGGGAIGSVS